MKAEDFIELIEQNRFDKISKNGMTLIAERFRELQNQQLTLTDVVVPKGTCCLKPKKIGKVNDMFESWDECKNCGKEVL